MSTYLLLRDNKQTGPYTLDEIRAKGFKPYDLIWVEGKSAGWRYPGELPEFASLAPMVEEQPFDRFYKRKPAETALKEPETIQKPVSPTEKPATIDLTQKGSSVYVAAPATGSTRIIVKSPRPETVPSPLAETSTEVKKPSYHPTKESKEQRPTNIEPIQLKEETKVNVGTTAKKYPISVYSIALKAAVLVIILLSGVIIGLLLNNNDQTTLKNELQAKMEQIKNRSESKPSNTENDPSTQIGKEAETTPVNMEALNSKDPVLATAINNIKKEVPVKKVSSPDVVNAQTEITDTKTTEPKTPTPKIEQVPARLNIDREKLLPFIQVEGKDYKVGVLGGISGLNLIVSNNSLYEIDALQIIIHYMGPENKIVKDQSVLITSIPAGQQKKIPIERSNRGVKLSYSIGKIEARTSDEVVSGF